MSVSVCQCERHGRRSSKLQEFSFVDEYCMQYLYVKKVGMNPGRRDRTALTSRGSWCSMAAQTHRNAEAESPPRK